MVWKRTAIYLFFILNASAILSIWWPYSGKLLLRGDPASILVSLANLAALSAVFLILTQIVLVGRVKWVERVFGLDNLWRWHHVIGLILPFLIVAHPLLLSIGYGMENQTGAWGQFLLYVSKWQYVNLALIAAILFVVLVVWAYLVVKKKINYEWWFLGHLFMYAAIVLAVFHQLGWTDDLNDGWQMTYWYAIYIFAFGNLILFRFVMPVYRTMRHGFVVDRVERETPDTVSIYISGRNLEKYPIKAGQFMILRFLDRNRWWQAHPFSLSTAPNGKFLRITVKSLGDYTSKLGDVKIGTKVLIDGPHGTFTLDRAYKNKLLLIAGGVGVTPIRSLFEQAIKNKLDVSVIYAARNSAQACLNDELNELAASCQAPMHCVLSDEDSWQGEKGFVDEERLRRLAPDIKERDVYFCGPTPMLKSVIPILKKLGVPDRQVHYEKFSL